MDKIDIYQEKWKIFIEGYKKEFKININDFIELINNEKLEFKIFFNITVNKILSNLNKENYVKDNKNILNKFSTWALIIINKLNISRIFKNFL